MRLREKLKHCWKWLRVNIFTKNMIFWVIIAEIIFWSPSIITAAFAIFINKWWWTMFTGIIIFWSGPFTPAVPLQLALAISLKQSFRRKTIYEKILRKLKKNER